MTIGEHELARQEFDHRVRIDRQTDVSGVPAIPAPSLSGFRYRRKPSRGIGRSVGDHAAIQVFQILAATNFDNVSWPKQVTWLGDFDSVDTKVTVRDPLPGLRTRFGEADASDTLSIALAHQQQ